MAKKDWMVTESMLDDDQIRVFQSTIDKSCVVRGCAGSGKSVLALLKAKRVEKERPRNTCRVVVYTKALCHYMEAGRNELGLRTAFEYENHWARRGSGEADYMVVDEIQDFNREEVQNFADAAKKHFYFFGDTAQSIYDGYPQKGQTMKVESIRDMFPEGKKPKEFELYRNYRLPLPVARVARFVGGDAESWDESVYKSPEREMPRFLSYPNPAEQAAAIVRIIKARSLGDVAVLLPNNKAVMNFYGMLRDASTHSGQDIQWEAKFSEGEGRWTDELNFGTENPKVMTYHSAKGLQFEAVFLPGLTPGGTAGNPLYVAMTRTYKYLFLMHSGGMPQPLCQVPASLYKNSEKDTVTEI